jgi:hypothetical protein
MPILVIKTDGTADRAGGIANMVSQTVADRPAWPADELVSELSIAAKAIGIDEAALATALADGLTIAQVARLHGVKPRRVVTTLVSHVVADVAADIRRGDLNSDQIGWLVALATWRAEQQVTCAFPPIEFRPVTAPGRGAAAPEPGPGSRS